MTRIGNSQPSTPLIDSNIGDVYAGGTVRFEVRPQDTQKDVTYRGLYKHAENAGLPAEECEKFAKQWASDFYLIEKGTKRPYTAKEFAALTKRGSATYVLNEQYTPNALNNLRERQAAYRLSQQNLQQQPPVNVASMSAPKYNDAEKVVNWITDGIQSITGSESEVGKQFNRLSVSTLRLLGSVGEYTNSASERLNDAIRYVAPDFVDQMLDQADENSRQAAQALKNANTVVTNEDRIDDLRAEKAGIKRPLAEDLHRKLMYFPEAIPNAIDSAIRGDLKDDDGSYSDKVGKIIGGLNPVGDIRDVAANIKNVSEGKPGSKVALGASIIGAIPLGGDAAKVLIKGNKEVIEEAIEGAVKTEAKAADKTFFGTLRGQAVELKNVEIRQIQYTKRPREEWRSLRSDFDRKVRSDFVKEIANNPEKLAELKRAGVKDNEILELRSGGIPDRFQVHHKLPLDDGGDNSFDNLVLIVNEPYHKAITNEQVRLTKGMDVGETRQLDWVTMPSAVYPPKP